MSAELWREFGPERNAELKRDPCALPVSVEELEGDDWGEFEDANVAALGDHTWRANEAHRSTTCTQLDLAMPRPQSDTRIVSDTEIEGEDAKISSAFQMPPATPSEGSRAVSVSGGTLIEDLKSDQDGAWQVFEGSRQFDVLPQSESCQPARRGSELQEAPSISDPRELQLADETTLQPAQSVYTTFSSSPAAPPPSNVPPPSMLLSLASTILSSLPAELKSLAVSTKTAPSHDQCSQNLETIANGISVLRAIARIIAGRKQRWKRDHLLAQSVRIGPSHGGKTGGMKLTGLDKNETRREDQEVDEVIKTWRQQAGTLKAALAKVSNVADGPSLIVSDISETLVARTAKGALSAPKSCVICGLKRDERVEKVDAGVDDSFGEYWEQHWGHVDCKRFWDTYKGSLQQR